jgi:hypothetical protein
MMALDIMLIVINKPCTLSVNMLNVVILSVEAPFRVVGPICKPIVYIPPSAPVTLLKVACNLAPRHSA